MKLLGLVAPMMLALTIPAFATVTVSTPEAGATVTSPVQYVASATTSTCSKGVASMGIYVNNKKIYVVSGTKLNHTISLATGNQHTVVEEWDKCGGASVTTINLTVVGAPTVSMSAKPTSIAAGKTSVLTVTAKNSTTVTIAGSDGTSYTLSKTGGTQKVTPAATTTYTASATGPAGTVTAKTTVTVTGSTHAPTVSIAANPASITSGNSSTLSVAATYATKVVITGSNGTSYTLGTSGGTQSVSPTATTTYTATATGSSGTTASSQAVVTVNAATPAPTVTLTANPTSIVSGSSSTLKVTATNANTVTLAGTDGTSVSLGASGGTDTVSPTSTATYTATATGSGGTVTAQATVTVTTKTITSIAVTPTAASFAVGATQQFTATATYSDNSTGDITSTANWSVANTAVATINSSGLATAVTAGSTSATASLQSISGTASFTVTNAQASGVTVSTWHVDNNRSGLNSNEQLLTTSNVNAQSFGKLFSYSVDGYAYAEPLLVSGLTINNVTRNVLFVATENDSVYAFDADNPGSGSPLWQVSLLQSGESPSTSGPIKPFEGVTSTPVIDTNSNTMYVLSKQTGNGSTFRLNALDLITGNQKFGGPVTIHASVPSTDSVSVNGVLTLPSSCTQRAALLLAYGNVYIGFGSCHTGWLLAYDAQALTQTAVWNPSPNLDGEGEYASAGGIWMGSGGPVADGKGNVYVTTGNGPWDGQTAFSDSIVKLSSSLQLEDYFTPEDYQYMDCNDSDLAAGGLILIPGTTKLLAGGKMGKLLLVDSGNLGQEQAGDAGAAQTLMFEPDLSSPYSSSCTDSLGTHTTYVNSYEIFGTSAYFNGAIYLGVTPTSANAPAGVRRFSYNGTLSAGSYTSPSIQQGTRGTTPFISSNGNSNGIMWMIDTGFPLQNTSGGGTTTAATLHAYDATNLNTELYNSSTNSGDQPGYGIKFSSPVVANGKVYISTGHDLTTASNPKGEIDVYGLN
jgi:hypothetical protein